MGYIDPSAASFSRDWSEFGATALPDSFTTNLLRRLNKNLRAGTVANAMISRAVRGQRNLHDTCSPTTWRRVLKAYAVAGRFADLVAGSLLFL
jgi:hypothetical protein